MKKNTLLYIIIILLLGFNGYFVATQFKKPPPRNKRGGPDVFITKELNFDENQMAQFDLLFEPHDNKMRALSRQKRELKDQLFKMMFQEDVPQTRIDAILEEIGQNEQERDRQVFQHFREVRKICNESQRKKFEKLVVGALHRNGPGPGPPPRQ